MWSEWRRKVSERGAPRLLVPSDEAYEAQKLRSRVPTSGCGVSLQFCAHLKASVEELRLEGKARSTQSLVARFFSPAGIVHQPEVKQRSSLDVRPVTRSVSVKPNTGALTSRERPNPAPPAGGVLASKELRTRLWDLLDPRWCGKPTHYVCHAWSGDFVELLETVVDRLLRQPELKKDPSDHEEEINPNNIFVWLDFLALPQQYLGGASSPEGPTFGPPHGYISMQEVRDIVTSCSSGTVVLLDKHMAVLGRVWPLYEVYLAAYYCPQDLSSSRVFAAIPKGMHVDQLLHLQNTCTTGIDLTRTASSKPDDKQHIMTEIRHSAGQKRVQAIISETLLRAARGWLRWSGNAEDIAQYASLMVASKEFAQLQYVLNSVDEIHDDEATLKEIRDLFALYDTDGTGSLEEDEFAQVLGMAGFGQEESRSIFKQVDTDGGGSVELDEFEAWWIETQRQHNRSCRPKPELSVKSLVANLRGLAAMLHRRENRGAEAGINKLCEELEAAAASPRSPFPDGQLPPTEVYGDWRTVANTLGFRIQYNDLRPALRMMHNLLLSNVDTLALDVNPAAQLPAPDSVGRDVRLQKIVLAWFLALMAELLSRNPQTMREANFFFREATDMAMPDKQEAGAHSASSCLDAAIQKAKRETHNNGRTDFEMESIVTNMVRLKHGKDTIVSNRLVAEANISLSAWMAASKERAHFQSQASRKFGPGQGSSAAVQAPSSIAAFTTNYLASTGEDNQNQKQDSNSSNGPGTEGQTSIDKKPTARRSPFDGLSHAQLARTLGQMCQEALKKARHAWQNGSSDSHMFSSEEDESEESNSDDSDSTKASNKPTPPKGHPPRMPQRSLTSGAKSMKRTELDAEKQGSPAKRPYSRQSTTPSELRRTGTNVERSGTPERRLTGTPTFHRSVTLANEKSSYEEKRRVPSRAPSRSNLSVNSGPDHSPPSRSGSSLGAPARPVVPKLRDMPSDSGTPPKLPRDEDSSHDGEGPPLSSSCSRRVSVVPPLSGIDELTAQAPPPNPQPAPQPPSNAHLPPRPPPTLQQHQHHHQHQHQHQHQHNYNSRPPSTQPTAQQPTSHHHQHHQHHHHQPLPPPPRAPSSAAPSPHPAYLQQEPSNSGSGRIAPPVPQVSKLRGQTKDEESEADAEVRRSLEAPPPNAPNPSRMIQTPLVGTMRSRLGPTPNPKPDPNAPRASATPVQMSQAPQHDIQGSSLFNLPWRRSGSTVPPQAVRTGDVDGKPVPMMDKVRGFFSRSSTSGLPDSPGTPTNNSVTSPRRPPHHLADPALPSDHHSLRVSSTTSQHRPSAFLSHTRADPSRGMGDSGSLLSAEEYTSSLNQPVEPQPSSSSATSALLRGGFAQRTAALGAQQRAVTPSLQPLVSSQDLEALRTRMSVPKGESKKIRTSSSGKSRAQSPEGSYSNRPEEGSPSRNGLLQPIPSRESSTGSVRERAPLVRSLQTPSLSAEGSLWNTTQHQSPSKPSGRNSVELGDPAGRPGSRLRNTTLPGLSQMSSRNALGGGGGAGVKSKWFNQFQGTNLPAASRLATQQGPS